MASPFDKIKGVLGTLAPTILTGLGGPLGGVAGSILGKVIKGDPKAAAEDVVSAITPAPDPDTVLKLKDAENQFQEFMAANNLSIQEADNEDRASARQMQISVKSLTPGLLTLIVTVGFFGLLFILTKRDVPAGSKEVLYSMVGVLGTAWVSIVNIYFGSSSGSADKTEALTSTLATAVKSNGK